MIAKSQRNWKFGIKMAEKWNYDDQLNPAQVFFAITTIMEAKENSAVTQRKSKDLPILEAKRNRILEVKLTKTQTIGHTINALEVSP